MSGTYTFSSKWPFMPPIVIAVSLPITWAPTWVTTSGMTGFTLPGMIELPGWSAGRMISASPARGPEPIRRRSLAILVSETATTLSAPDASTRPSRADLGLELVGGRRDVQAGLARASRARTRAANSGCVLSPVPAAVPPSGIWPRRAARRARVRCPAAPGGVARELLARA